MIPEVERLISSHKTLRDGAKGPDPHNAILKASVVMLSATWELYCETVVIEAAKKLVEKFETALNLPDAMQKQLVQEVHNENVWKSDPLKLSGLGWRTVFMDLTQRHCDRLNTPKSEKLNDLFKKCLGVKRISDAWSHGAKEIDDFVVLRGEIAHRGSDAQSVSRSSASHFKSVISKTITDTDDAIYDYLKQPDLLGKVPWQKTSK